MLTLAVPAAYARRSCGLFLELAAANIDTHDLVCSEPIDSGNGCHHFSFQDESFMEKSEGLDLR